MDNGLGFSGDGNKKPFFFSFLKLGVLCLDFTLLGLHEDKIPFVGFVLLAAWERKIGGWGPGRDGGIGYG
jgi:hypothetical protein